MGNRKQSHLIKINIVNMSIGSLQLHLSLFPFSFLTSAGVPSYNVIQDKCILGLIFEIFESDINK